MKNETTTGTISFQAPPLPKRPTPPPPPPHPQNYNLLLLQSLSRNSNLTTFNSKTTFPCLSPPPLNCKLYSTYSQIKGLTIRDPIPSTCSSTTTFHGHCYVVGNNNYTNKIIPATKCYLSFSTFVDTRLRIQFV